MDEIVDETGQYASRQQFVEDALREKIERLQPVAKDTLRHVEQRLMRTPDPLLAIQPQLERILQTRKNKEKTKHKKRV